MTEITLVGLLIAHLALTGVPFVAACLVARHWGVRQPAVLLATGLATSGALAMLDFWAFYASPSLGKVIAFVTVAVATGLVVLAPRSPRVDAETWRTIAVPTLLWAFGSGFVLFLGFLHGGSSVAIAASAERWFPSQMASDNDIPQFFASWYYVHGHHGVPPVYPGGWLASDRPPLQIGYVNMQRPFGWDSRGLNYQVVGVVLQQMWIIGLWALLVAARLQRQARGLAMLAVLASGFAIVNGFYVWPKLLPAAALLAAAALIITPLWDQQRTRAAAGALVAALLALSMLGHGASVFGILPLLILAAWRGLPTPRWLIAAVVTAVALYTPWMAYQKYADPPGNRLTRWAVAGDIRVATPRHLALSQDVENAYRRIGVGGAIHNKAENVVTTVGGGPMASELKTAADAVGQGHLEIAVFQLRNIAFFNLLPGLGLYLLAPLIMVAGRMKRRYASAEWKLSRDTLVLAATGTLVWWLILFGNSISRTDIHQGTYLLPIVLLVFAVTGMQAVSTRVAVIITGVAVLSTLALYAPSFTPPPASHYSPYAIALSALSLVCFGVLAFMDQLAPVPWGAHRHRQRFTADAIESSIQSPIDS